MAADRVTGGRARKENFMFEFQPLEARKGRKGRKGRRR